MVIDETAAAAEQEEGESMIQRPSCRCSKIQCDSSFIVIYEVTCVTLVMATPTASSLFCFASHHRRETGQV